MPRTLKVDLFTDVVCPWCLIGSVRLDKAIAALPADVTVDVEKLPSRIRVISLCGVSSTYSAAAANRISTVTPVWTRNTGNPAAKAWISGEAMGMDASPTREGAKG